MTGVNQRLQVAERLDKICLEKLTSFLKKMNDNNKLLREHSTELNKLSISIIAESQRIQQLENIK